MTRTLALYILLAPPSDAPAPPNEIIATISEETLTLRSKGLRKWSDFISGNPQLVVISDSDIPENTVLLEGRTLVEETCGKLAEEPATGEIRVCFTIPNDLELVGTVDVTVGTLAANGENLFAPRDNTEIGEPATATARKQRTNAVSVPALPGGPPEIESTVAHAYLAILEVINAQNFRKRGLSNRNDLESRISILQSLIAAEPDSDLSDIAGSFITSAKYRDEVVLVLTNSGEVVGSKPKLDENDEIHILVLGPVSSVLATCDDAPLFRTRRQSGLGTIVSFLSDDDKPIELSKFKYAKVESCSGDTGLDLAIGSPEPTGAPPSKTPPNTKNFPVAKLYRASISAGVIYSFARSQTFQTESFAGSSETRIARRDATEGVGGVVTAQVHLRRVDAVSARTRPLELISPAIGFSVSEPLENLYLGIALEPWPGFGLLGGYHFHSEERLKNGFRPGDPVTGETPTQRVWSAPDGKDWFIGAIVTSDLVNFILEKGKGK